MHTTGPWLVDLDTIRGHASPTTYSPHIASLAQRTYEPGEAAANARLIAAAPDLLAACERLLRAEREGWNVGKMDFPPIDDVRAAISKAKGGA